MFGPKLEKAEILTADVIASSLNNPSILTDQHACEKLAEDLTSLLIALDTQSVFGKDLNLTPSILETLLKPLGFETNYFLGDYLFTVTNNPNSINDLKCNQEIEIDQLIICHIDVVQQDLKEDEGRYVPLKGKFNGERFIAGRGAIDCKGQLAAAIIAVAKLKHFGGDSDFMLAIPMDEEIRCPNSQRVLNLINSRKPILDLEPTGNISGVISTKVAAHHFVVIPELDKKPKIPNVKFGIKETIKQYFPNFDFRRLGIYPYNDSGFKIEIINKSLNFEDKPDQELWKVVFEYLISNKFIKSIDEFCFPLNENSSRPIFAQSVNPQYVRRDDISKLLSLLSQTMHSRVYQENMGQLETIIFSQVGRDVTLAHRFGCTASVCNLENHVNISFAENSMGGKRRHSGSERVSPREIVELSNFIFQASQLNQSALRQEAIQEIEKEA